MLDFVSFFERILLDFGRFSNITARVVLRKRTERLTRSVVEVENVCNGLAVSKRRKSMKIQDGSGFWPISVISAISHNHH